jgi:uncharacterized membrane protein
MADYPAEVQQTPNPSATAPVSAILAVYVLFGIAAVVGIAGHGLFIGAPLLTLLGLVAVIIAYVKRDDARGTWTASHVTWLIRTFWWSFLWNVIGWIVAVTVIGIPVAWVIWVATTIWVIYRLVRGYLYFKDSQPIPDVA